MGQDCATHEHSGGLDRGAKRDHVTYVRILSDGVHSSRSPGRLRQVAPSLQDIHPSFSLLPFSHKPPRNLIIMVSSSYTSGNMSSPNASIPVSYFPAIRPAALALGTVFEHVTSALVYGPLFGQTWEKVMNADKNSEFWKTKEAQSAVSIYSASLVSSGFQTYCLSALLQLTGTVSYKGTAYLGLIVFGATSVPGIVSSVFAERRPLEYTAIKSVTGLIQTVGLGLVLTAFGHRRDVIS